MKLAISNIAWDNELNDKVYSLMKNYGFTGLEIAPTKVFENFPEVSIKEINQLQSKLKEYGIELVAAQSLLFGKQELKLFDSSRDSLKDYLKRIIDFSEKANIKSLIFGSPKNRIYEGISLEEAIKISKDFFKDLGDYCKDKGVFICIEPNPEIYGGNFLCNTKDTFEFIKELNHSNIKLHLDLGTIISNNEDINLIKKYKDYITHFHISEPYLDLIKDREELYKLKDLLNGYDGFVSIEMKNTSIDNIKDTFELISKI